MIIDLFVMIKVHVLFSIIHVIESINFYSAVLLKIALIVTPLLNLFLDVHISITYIVIIIKEV